MYLHSYIGKKIDNGFKCCLSFTTLSLSLSYLKTIYLSNEMNVFVITYIFKNTILKLSLILLSPWDIIYNVLYQLVWTGTSESAAPSLALTFFMESIAILHAIVALDCVIMYMAVEFYKVMLNFFNYC